MTHLALVLPGSGYGPAGPVLLIPRLAAEQVGAETLDVTYPDWRPGMDAERAAEFAAIVGQQIRKIIERVQPQRVSLLAKSLGCEVVARLDPSVVAAAPRVEVVWLTPVFELPVVRDGAISKAWRSLVVSGEADRWYDEGGTRAVLDATMGSSHVLIAGANHSLEVERNVVATVNGLGRLADAVLAFLG